MNVIFVILSSIWQRAELTLRFCRGTKKETITFSPLHSSIEDIMEIHFIFTWQKLLSISWHHPSWPMHLHVSLNHGPIFNWFFSWNLRCSYRYHLYLSWSSFLLWGGAHCGTNQWLSKTTNGPRGNRYLETCSRVTAHSNSNKHMLRASLAWLYYNATVKFLVFTGLNTISRKVLAVTPRVER